MTVSSIFQDYMQEGTHASRPAAPAVGTNGIAFYYETDTTKLFMWDSTGAAWVQINGSAGGSGLFSPVLSAVPTGANTGLSTWVNQSTCTVADTSVGICITAPNAGGTSLSSRIKTAPSTPYTITALVAHIGIPGGSVGTGIGWYDGSNKLHTIGLSRSSGSGNFLLAVDKWTNSTTFSAEDFTGVQITLMPLSPVWIGLSDDGTTAKFLASSDGKNFVTIFSVTKSGSFLGATGFSNIAFFAKPEGADIKSTLMSYTQS